MSPFSLRSDPFCDPWSGNELIVSSSLAFESDIPMKADSLSVPRHREEESLSIYPYTYQQMWFQGSVDCPSPAARGGETNDVPAWAGHLSANYSLSSAQRP